MHTTWLLSYHNEVGASHTSQSQITNAPVTALLERCPFSPSPNGDLHPRACLRTIQYALKFHVVIFCIYACSFQSFFYWGYWSPARPSRTSTSAYFLIRNHNDTTVSFSIVVSLNGKTKQIRMDPWALPKSNVSDASPVGSLGALSIEIPSFLRDNIDSHLHGRLMIHMP